MGTACPSWTRNACVAPSPRATSHTLPVPNGADTNQTGTPDNSITPTPTPIPGPTPNQLVWTYGITEAVAPEGADQRSVTGLAIDLDGNRILVGFTDDPSTETAARALHMLDDRPFTLWSVSVGGPVTGVDISDDGSRTMAGSADRKISSYNMDEAVRWTVESSDVGANRRTWLRSQQTAHAPWRGTRPARLTCLTPMGPRTGLSKQTAPSMTLQLPRLEIESG